MRILYHLIHSANNNNNNIFFSFTYNRNININTMETPMTSFPANLSYSIKTLSNFSKTTVKLTPDRTGIINAGETFRTKLPSNALIDLRTICMYTDASTQSGASDNLHFPRFSSSIIKTLSIYANNTLLERVDGYSNLYNSLFDLEAGQDQVAKRGLENADPSVGYSVDTDHTAGTIILKTRSSVQDDTDMPLVVNNWLGFISTASTPVIDTNDWGLIEIEITLEPANVLWASAGGVSGVPISAGANYSIKNTTFTISKVTFNDPLYYNLKAAKLLSGGLTVGYDTYIASKTGAVAKGSSVNVLTTVNSTSLNQLICIFAPAVSPISKLQLSGAGNANAGVSFNQVLASNYAGQTDASVNHISAGDLYNQSVYFKSDATGLTSSSLNINNTPLMAQPLSAAQVYNETLIALGNNNIDLSAGVHEGCRSLPLFLKYYFTHIVSLENISHGGGWTKSGLDGKSAALNVSWNMVFSNTTAELFTPIIYAKVSRIAVINEGQSITIIV